MKSGRRRGLFFYIARLGCLLLLRLLFWVWLQEHAPFGSIYRGRIVDKLYMTRLASSFFVCLSFSPSFFFVGLPAWLCCRAVYELA